MAKATIRSKYNVLSLQDMGRVQFRKYGIPISGPMIPRYADQANHLLGNHNNEAVLEFYNRPLILQFDEECVISIVGHDGHVLVNGQEYRSHIICLKKNDLLEIPFNNQVDTWKYLAIKSGWQGQVVLNSKADNVSLGITVEDDLHYSPSSEKMPIIFFNKNNHPGSIKIYPAPESNLIDADVWDRVFSISNQSNRMAYILNEKIVINDFQEIKSVGVFPGIVQLTASGEVYILMRDAQVTGGYPRIGYLDMEGLEQLALIPFGSEFKFVPVS